MKTPRKKVPVVNFTDNCITFKDLLDRLEIPEELQYKGESLEDPYRLTQQQIKETLKNTELLQKGKIIESDEEYLSYQVYGDLRNLYICLFTENNQCCEVYRIRDWYDLSKLVWKN